MSNTNKEEGIPLNYEDNVDEMIARTRVEREKAMAKAKKRKKLFVIIAIVFAALAAIIALVIFILSKATPPMASTINPMVGDIEATVNVSGYLESERNVQFYAPSAILVESVMTAGEAVEKGDILIKFQEEDYARALREIEIENEIANNSYQSNLSEHESNKKELATAKANAVKYRKLRDQQQATVNQLTASITDANALRAAQIEVEIYECQKKIDDYTYCIQNAKMLGMGAEGVEAYTRYIHSESQKIASLQHELSQLSGSVAALQQQKALTDAQKLLADYESELTKAETKQETMEGLVGNEYDEKNLILNGELSTMRAGQAYEEILQYDGGLVSEFSGVVLNSSVKAGEKTVPGSVLLTIASTEAVKIRFDINKNDLLKLELGQKATVTVLDKEYTATVSKINRVATSYDSGASSLSAEVSIDNPDSEIYLGMDAKVIIHTAEREDVLMLPVQVVNSDKSGDFVYLIENGVVCKRYITVGISSDEFIEIVDGLTVDDAVVSVVTVDVVEGAVMVAVPDVMLQMQMMPTEPVEEEDALPEEPTETGVISEDAALPKEEEEE